MSRQPLTRWTEARALLRSGPDEFLIIKTTADPSANYEFPGGRVADRESPEAALRRLCREQLGVTIDFQIGQPPFQYAFGTHTVTFRYYICSIRAGEIAAVGCVEPRWVARAQLRDYIFDAPTQQVVDWLVEAPLP
ncbi:MAG: NUDIX domain-containing protein [Phycisphaerales bacterium]|nr:NUDIX domain-containing protein [Phycisphaerales bacterium]